MVNAGLPKPTAVAAVAKYRDYMAPAGWTVYNDDPADSAEQARSLLAWDVDAAADQVPIDRQNLSERARKVLDRLNISTAGELVQRSDDEVLDVKNFGETTLKELGEKLKALRRTSQAE